MTSRAHTLTACILAIVGLYIVRIGSAELQPNIEAQIALQADGFLHGYTASAIRLGAVFCSALALLLLFRISRRVVSYQGSFMVIAFTASTIPWVHHSRHAYPHVPMIVIAVAILFVIVLLLERFKQANYVKPFILFYFSTLAVSSILVSNSLFLYFSISLFLLFAFESTIAAGMRRRIVLGYFAVVAGVLALLTTWGPYVLIVVAIGVPFALLTPKRYLDSLAIRGYKPILIGAIVAMFFNVIAYLWVGDKNDIVGGREAASLLVESGYPSFVYITHDTLVKHTMDVNPQLKWYLHAWSAQTTVPHADHIYTVENRADVVNVPAQVGLIGKAYVVYYHPGVDSATVTSLIAGLATSYDAQMSGPNYTVMMNRASTP